MLKLYSYYRSSAAYRVRIALHWKELPFEYIPVHLVKAGGEQHGSQYRKVNPMGHVPALDDNGFLVAESVAIIRYLDDICPGRPLFPSDPQGRAKVLQICEVINSGIQPLQNLKVTQALERDFHLSPSEVERWTRHWITSGLQNLEQILESTAGSFCYKGRITAADCFLVPQCFSARRFGVRVEEFPTIARIERRAAAQEAFIKAHPEKQPDFTV
ncbi:MAG: maleylacetoacetate isomerase [Bdellovibrionales bacterium]